MKEISNKSIEENPVIKTDINNMDEKSNKSIEEPQVIKTDLNNMEEKSNKSIKENPIHVTDPGASPDKKKKIKNSKPGEKETGKSLKKGNKAGEKDKKSKKNKKIDHLGKKTTRKIRKMTKKLEKATIISVLIKDQVDQLNKKIGRLKKNIISGKESAMPRINLRRISSRLKTAGLELKEAKEMQVLIREKIRKRKEKIRKLKSGK